MFAAADRDRVRTQLLERARRDVRITSAALTGSAARGAEDRWSDIDLLFAVDDDASTAAALTDWTDFMYRALGALHHFDLRPGGVIYRVFLLPDCLEVDLAFTVAKKGAGAHNAHTIFGEAIAPPAPPSAQPDHLAGLAWHHVLRAHAAIGRARPWQAEYRISGIRDQVLRLACHRLGRPASEATGADDLPGEITDALRDGLVRTLDTDELHRALAVLAPALLCEIFEFDPGLADRLAAALSALTASDDGRLALAHPVSQARRRHGRPAHLRAVSGDPEEGAWSDA